MNWNTPKNQKLIKALLSLETKQEATDFLRDLMTENEIDEFAKRLYVAERLSENTPYSQIEKETGFSSTTIARVSKWLNSDLGGYKKILNKINHHSSHSLMKK